MCVGFQCRHVTIYLLNFVYISNQSSVNVFFDNLQVRHDRGRIIEENHYYAHGLKIAAISSKAYGAPNNNYLYQGDFSDFDDDLGWNDFELRSYDPQIGRFLQNDPYDQFASGYVGMGNDPVNGVDPSGGLVGDPGGIGKIGAAINAAAGFGNIASGVGRVLSIAVNAISLTSQGISNAQSLVGPGDPPTKKPPSMQSRRWAEEVTRKARKPRIKIRPPNPLLMILYMVFSPSDANSEVDDTPDGEGGWKKLEREQLALEHAEDDFEDKNPDIQVRYVTYTKTRLNKDGTNTVYSGRTSGLATESAADIVKRRDKQHKAYNINLRGYQDAEVDQESVGSKKNSIAKYQIRGREQQLIDSNGGAIRDNNGTSGNIIRGVSKYNRRGGLYHIAATKRWGLLHPFTGLFW